jgi:hypothetical protein
VDRTSCSIADVVAVGANHDNAPARVWTIRKAIATAMSYEAGSADLASKAACQQSFSCCPILGILLVCAGTQMPILADDAPCLASPGHLQGSENQGEEARHY